MKSGKGGPRAWIARGCGGVREVLEACREALADGTRMAGFMEGFLRFEPRPDDIYIVTYPRSGTTWMQFLVYLLTSDRTVDFDHVSRVCPWFERSLALGTRTVADYAALPAPRRFKSHLRPEWVPRPGRVIYVERDGRDVLVSYFHFYRSHLRFEGTFDDFFERFMTGTLQYRSWFDHVEAWRRAREKRSVLWVRYEDMKAEPLQMIDRVADYIGVSPTANQRDQIAEMVAYDFMKAHESKFDPITEHLIDHRLISGAFIRSGAPGSGKTRLTPRQIERFETRHGKMRKVPGVELRLADFLH